MNAHACSQQQQDATTHAASTTEPAEAREGKGGVRVLLEGSEGFEAREIGICGQEKTVVGWGGGGSKYIDSAPSQGTGKQGGRQARYNARPAGEEGGEGEGRR
jgi:hypothetical protein